MDCFVAFAPRNDEFDPIGFRAIVLLADLPPWQFKICTIGLRQINPTGKSLLIFRNGVKPRNQKYFCFHLTQISSLIRPVSSHQRGDRASSRARGGMRWT
jgi:hypothetical protein